MESDIDALLTKTFGEPVPSGPETKAWITPYGFNIAFLSPLIGYAYTYEYIPFLGDSKRTGMIPVWDVQKILEKLKQDPDLLRRKPASIVKIEEATKGLNPLVGRRHDRFFGVWQCGKVGEVSLFTNPFDVSIGGSSHGDEFEVWFMKEGVKDTHVATEKVIELLKKNGFGR